MNTSTLTAVAGDRQPGGAPGVTIVSHAAVAKRFSTQTFSAKSSKSCGLFGAGRRVRPVAARERGFGRFRGVDTGLRQGARLSLVEAIQLRSHGRQFGPV